MFSSSSLNFYRKIKVNNNKLRLHNALPLFVDFEFFFIFHRKHIKKQKEVKDEITKISSEQISTTRDELKTIYQVYFPI